MKGLNLKNTLFVAIITMCSFLATANTTYVIDPSNLEVQSSEESVIIILHALSSEKTELTLTNEAGEVLFTKEIVDRLDYGLGLDLTNLDAGEYELKVNRSTKTFYQKITITRNNEILLSAMELELKPAVTAKDDNSFSVNNPNGVISSVSLMDDNGETVYTKAYNEENSKSAQSIRYNLEQSKAGTYNVRIETIFNTVYYDKVIIK